MRVEQVRDEQRVVGEQRVTLRQVKSMFGDGDVKRGPVLGKDFPTPVEFKYFTKFLHGAIIIDWMAPAKILAVPLCISYGAAYRFRQQRATILNGLGFKVKSYHLHLKLPPSLGA